jgi:hypothetical protein
LHERVASIPFMAKAGGMKATESVTRAMAARMVLCILRTPAVLVAMHETGAKGLNCR